jgi:membrane protein YdbS with pleckstrin-like domain
MRQADPMAPDDVTWRAVSPRLALARRIVAGVLFGVVAVALITVAALADRRSFALSAVVPLLLFGWAWWVIGRQVRALGYAERDDDLLVRRGVMFRSLVVVPYGRMQFVDVGAGPLDRSLGIARVQLHTASPASDASIPGLPPERAAELRDRLASRGEARLAGL